MWFIVFICYFICFEGCCIGYNDNDDDLDVLLRFIILDLDFLQNSIDCDDVDDVVNELKVCESSIILYTWLAMVFY